MFGQHAMQPTGSFGREPNVQPAEVCFKKSRTGRSGPTDRALSDSRGHRAPREFRGGVKHRVGGHLMDHLAGRPGSCDEQAKRCHRTNGRRAMVDPLHVLEHLRAVLAECFHLGSHQVPNHLGKVRPVVLGFQQFQQPRARDAAEHLFDPRLQQRITKLGELAQSLIDRLNFVVDHLPFTFAKQIQRRSRLSGHSGADQRVHAEQSPADRVETVMDGLGQSFALVLPPESDFLHDHQIWYRRPVVVLGDLLHQHEVRDFLKLHTATFDLTEIRRHARLWIQHAAQRTAQRPQFDLMKMQGRDVVFEVSRSVGQVFNLPVLSGQVGNLPHIKRQPILLRRAAVGRGEVNELRSHSGLLAEGPQPDRPIRFVIREQHLIEDHEHRFVFLGRFAKELFDGRVVVLLLRQHGDEHIGAAADVIGSFPIHAHVAVDVGSVEDQQIGRRGLAGPPKQAMLWMIFERRVCGRPLMQLKSAKDRIQVVPLVESRWHQADGVLRP